MILTPCFVREWMQQQYKTYGLEGWTFEFDRAKTRAGLCNYAKKRITISWHFLTNPQVSEGIIVDIMKHELAHALTPGHGHNDVWKMVAQSLGCTGNRCCPAFSTPKYVGRCACHGKVVTRHRLTRRRPMCKKCNCSFLFAHATTS